MGGCMYGVMFRSLLPSGESRVCFSILDYADLFNRSGSHLKETATGVEGTFRVSGSAKRMKDLQAIFDSPPKVGVYHPFTSLSLTPILES